MSQDSEPSDYSPLSALSPLDGRYLSLTDQLRPLWSESGLIRARIKVEARWLVHLIDELNLKNPSKPIYEELFQMARDPEPMAAQLVKKHESTTNHDVKAVEYYVRDRLKGLGASPELLAYIHFGCTSEDINNLAYGDLLTQTKKQILLPQIGLLIQKLDSLISSYKHLPMLSRTHGQPATPTTLGKELAVFAHRIAKRYRKLALHGFEGKLNGAVGNFNAHYLAYPKLDWLSISQRFIENRMGLNVNFCTTQIENHDSVVEFASSLMHLNSILIGFCQDMWHYISRCYFNQISLKDEVGSSTMPHKVNPIDFENAEGNFGLANASLKFFCDKLPISRMQRDLSDSTVQRNWGSLFGYTLIGLKSILKGLDKVKANPSQLKLDLDNAPEILAEPLQTMMRKHGMPDAYEKLKELTRGQKVDSGLMAKAFDGTSLSQDPEILDLVHLNQANYLGLAVQIAERVQAELKLLAIARI